MSALPSLPLNQRARRAVRALAARYEIQVSGSMDIEPISAMRESVSVWERELLRALVAQSESENV